jgi:hypothetical protein
MIYTAENQENSWTRDIVRMGEQEMHSELWKATTRKSEDMGGSNLLFGNITRIFNINDAKVLHLTQYCATSMQFRTSQ